MVHILGVNLPDRRLVKVRMRLLWYLSDLR